jgi:hypothetical protein
MPYKPHERPVKPETLDKREDAKNGDQERRLPARQQAAAFSPSSSQLRGEDS